MSIKDWNTTAANNTTISGINIAEGCPPSGLNDAIRQLMADVKTGDWNGASINASIPGTLIASSNLSDLSDKAAAASNLGYSRRNKLINGAFRVNQRAHTSGAALVQGVPSTGVGYGHDGWRAGASGCTYTFTQSKGPTTITITAGSLISKVEDADIDQSAMILSWTGTAQARVGVNGAEPSGAYASSPILISATVGASVAVEFGTGTVDRVQLENGSFKTPFEWLPIQQAEELCQRYCPVFATLGEAGAIGQGVALTTTNGTAFISFPVPTRVVPTGIVVSSAGDFYYGGQACTSLTIGASSSRYVGQVSPAVASGLTANVTSVLRFNNTTSDRLRFTGAEL